MTKYWFKAKNYGYGWYPATKEGWTVMAIFGIALVLSGFLSAQIAKSEDEFAIIYTLFTLFESIVLIFVCYKTGEKPGWRWGNKKS